MEIDSYDDAGLLVTVELINELSVGDSPPGSGLATVRSILAVDPASVAQLADPHVADFVALACRLHRVVTCLDADDLDTAAGLVNEMLDECPARPHLAKEDGRWRLHRHPADTALVPMWIAICAESLARLIGNGRGDRLGTCAAPHCDRVYLDQTRNGSRRFCSTTCQNRVKAAAFRDRRRGRHPR